jgi:hypothetical protein
MARIGVARALMQVIDGELAGAASVLQVLALSPLIASGNFAGFQDRAMHALTTTSGNNIVLSRPDDAQVVNTLKPFGTPLPAYGAAGLQRRTLEAGRPVVSDVFIGPVAGQAIVAVEVPVIIDGKPPLVLRRTRSPPTSGPSPNSGMRCCAICVAPTLLRGAQPRRRTLSRAVRACSASNASLP